MHEPRSAFRKILAEILPADMPETGAGEARHVDKDRIAPAAPPRGSFVIAGRQPDSQFARARITQRIVAQHAGLVLEHNERSAVPLRALQSHTIPSPVATDSTRTAEA